MGKTLQQLNVKPGDVVRLRNFSPDVVERISDGKYFMDDGEWYDGNATEWAIVSRAAPDIDLTAITTPLGLLDDATREALKSHGGPYQRYASGGWAAAPIDPSRWHPVFLYRVKPSPKVETVVLNGVKIDGEWQFNPWQKATDDTHKLTLTIQDGDIIDVKPEKLP